MASQINDDNSNDIPSETKSTTLEIGLVENSSAEKICSFYETESNAAEAYQLAAEKVEDDELQNQFQDCETSHRERARQLKETMDELGIEPDAEAQTAGGAFTSVIQSKSASDKEITEALAAEEEANLQTYQNECAEGTPAIREVVAKSLLTPQEETHDAMSILKMSIR